MINAKRACQQAIILDLLIEIAELGIKNGKTNQKVIDLKRRAEEQFDFILEKSEKLKKRCRKSGNKIFFLFRDVQTNFVNTHKLILALHQVGDHLIENGLMCQETREILQGFLNIEGQQNTTFEGKPISDHDWIKLKNSADKKVEDIIEIIKNI